MNHRSDRRRVLDRAGSDIEGDGDELADLLADPHCRYLLEYLRQHEDPADVTTLTEYVVAEVTDTPPDSVSDDVQRRVQTWLHHGQLPTLDRYGVVDFDADAGTVSLTDTHSS